MADFCLECFNKLNDTDYRKEDVVEEYGICEGCGEYKDCVVDLRGYGLIDLVSRLYIKLFKKGKPHETQEQDTLDI